MTQTGRAVLGPALLNCVSFRGLRELQAFVDLDTLLQRSMRAFKQSIELGRDAEVLYASAGRLIAQCRADRDREQVFGGICRKIRCCGCWDCIPPRGLEPLSSG